MRHREGMVHWHMALVKATARFRSGDFDPSMVLSPVLIQPKTRGLKEEEVRAVVGSSSCFPCTFGVLCNDTVPRVGFNPSLPAWWKSRVSVCLLRVGW